MKVKIKNIDEFCEALKAGHLLKNEFGETITIQNNMFCFKHKPAGWNGEEGFCTNVSYFGYKKPDSLKIEVDKFYETRDGSKAYVFAKTEAGTFRVCARGTYYSYSVNSNGKAVAYRDEVNTDLVSEWKEDK